MNNRIFRLIAVSGAAVALSACTIVDPAGGENPETAASAETAENTTVSAEQAEEITVELISETTEEQVTEPLTELLEMPEDYELSGSCRLDVEAVLQNPELPTGCEITSLDTVLRYNGFDIDKVELCENYLTVDYYATYTFDEAYIGDPKSATGFGCYSPVITETANKFFSENDDSWKALDISGTSLQGLFYHKLRI